MIKRSQNYTPIIERMCLFIGYEYQHTEWKAVRIRNYTSYSMPANFISSVKYKTCNSWYSTDQVHYPRVVEKNTFVYWPRSAVYKARRKWQQYNIVTFLPLYTLFKSWFLLGFNSITCTQTLETRTIERPLTNNFVSLFSDSWNCTGMMNCETFARLL